MTQQPYNGRGHCIRSWILRRETFFFMGQLGSDEMSHKLGQMKLTGQTKSYRRADEIAMSQT